MTDATADATNLSRYEEGRKSTGIAYLLWFFLGLFGAHRLYASAGKSGWYLMALHVGGWLLIALAFWFGSHSTTETVYSAFGVESFTDVTTTSHGGVVAWIGRVMRDVAWLWWLVDIFLVPGIVRRWNNALAVRLGLGGLR
jgi:TM2 domain-containing membrane protein YozV